MKYNAVFFLVSLHALYFMIGTTQKNAKNTLPIKVLKYTYYHTKCSQYDLKRSTNAEGRLCMQRIDTAEPLFFIACLVSFFFLWKGIFPQFTNSF